MNESVRKKIRDEAKARKEVRQERLADNNEDKKEDEDLFMVESARILGDWIRLGVKNN